MENTVRKRNAVANSGLQLHTTRPRSISHADRKDGARKNIQLTPTRWKMKIRLSQVRTAPGTRGLRSVNFLSAASAPPWIPPQTRNVQLAPCHKPPSSMVSKRLR